MEFAFLTGGAMRALQRPIAEQPSPINREKTKAIAGSSLPNKNSGQEIPAGKAIGSYTSYPAATPAAALRTPKIRFGFPMSGKTATIPRRAVHQPEPGPAIVPKAPKAALLFQENAGRQNESAAPALRPR